MFSHPCLISFPLHCVNFVHALVCARVRLYVCISERERLNKYSRKKKLQLASTHKQDGENKTAPENIYKTGAKLTLVNEQENCPSQKMLEIGRQRRRSAVLD